MKRKRRCLREPINSISHFAGVLLAIPGLLFLLYASDNATKTFAYLVYGTSLIVLYLSSALYHGLNLSHKNIHRLRRLDHSAIFLLIAGSYTPICLILLAPPLGTILFSTVWAFAIVGIFYYIVFVYGLVCFVRHSAIV